MAQSTEAIVHEWLTMLTNHFTLFEQLLYTVAYLPTY